MKFITPNVGNESRFNAGSSFERYRLLNTGSNVQRFGVPADVTGPGGPELSITNRHLLTDPRSISAGERTGGAHTALA